jgi:hypothetical protein
MEVTIKKVKKFTLVGNTYKKITQLSNFGYSFTVSYTQRTCRIVIPEINEVYIKGGNGYTFKEFNDQKKLRKYIRDIVEKNSMEIPNYNSSDISYNCYSDYILDMPIDHKINDITELDVNKAYYQCAYNLGYISKDMYEKYITLPKDVRLRFIGTIATRKRIYKYDNGELNDEVEIKEDEILRRVWFHICKNIDNAMIRFKELTGDNFLMYYVDGIYLKKGDYSKELDILKNEFNLDFKNESVQYITKKYVRPEKSSERLCVVISKFNKKKNCFDEKTFVVRTKSNIEFDTYGDIIKENCK